MQIAEHLEHLAAEGGRLAATAQQHGLDATVTTCPGWQMRDLLTHLSQVHRWATAYVVTGRTTPPGDSDQLVEPPSADDDLVGWFGDGHAALVEALRTASDQLDCWAFLPAPSPRAFWARRQAHETAIHRADAETAAGLQPSYDATFAADGIDELLLGFFGRPGGRLRSDVPVRLGLRATDVGESWTVAIGPDGRTTSKGDGDADCTVSGSATDLYLLMWNRGDPAALDVVGKSDVLDLWRDNARISFR